MCSVSASTDRRAQHWFADHYFELRRRSRRHFHCLPFHQREEAVAETLAQAFKYVDRAAVRGRLASITPGSLARYFSLLVWQGRRLAGSSSNDALAEGSGRKRRTTVLSLDQDRRIRTRQGEMTVRLSTILADGRVERPDQQARVNLDYPAILDLEQADRKARRLFRFLCETHGAGIQGTVARELGLSAGTITRSRQRLARSLARYGYYPPPTRPVPGRPKGRRGRRPANPTGGGHA